MLNKELTVGQLAARSGVAVTALHFTKPKGLSKVIATPAINGATRGTYCVAWW